jgi:hypothetical protein
VLRAKVAAAEGGMANISIVPSGVDSVLLSIGGQTVVVELTGTKSDEKSSAVSGSKGDSTKPTNPGKPTGGPITKPPGPIFIAPYLWQSRQQEDAGMLLRTVQLSIAHASAGLDNIADAFRGAARADEDARHLVVHHSASVPLDLEKVVAEFGPLKSEVEVTILITPEDG